MRQGIKIKVIREPDDDGTFQFEINLANEETSTSLQFWGYGDTFKQFGERLTDFPMTIKDNVTYELGEDKNNGQPKWAYYMLLNVFCFDSAGQSAIKVIVDNHQDIPSYQRSEFYIKAEPGSLNNLGQQLRSWNPETEKELDWVAN
jgi:hypothetical protein